MNISVIIPTKERPNDLAAMLKSLLTQSMQATEVIIIDQSNNDASRLVSEKILRDNPRLGLNYILDTQITGAAQARNKGIKVAQGDIIFFFDDDVVLDRDFIKESLKIYDDHPDVAGVGGVITNYQHLNSKRFKINRRIFFRGIFKEERSDIFANYLNYDHPIPTSKLSGGCCSYKRKILEKEWFDERFDRVLNGYAFGEDIDLSLRISRKSPLLITPFARLEHHHTGRPTDKKENQFYLEVASWTYIFFKTFSRNLKAWCCFIWVCLGWLTRCLKNLLMLDASVFKALFRGIHTGYRLWRSRGIEGNLV